MEKFLKKTPTQQRAYAIAFVLSIKQVLAQDSTKDLSQKSQLTLLID
jgi:hypothetical protein